MNVSDSLGVALRALATNKLRSSLTMLGIIIGVGAVITLMSVGRGAERQITQQIQGMGSNLLFITPGAAQQGGVRLAAGTRPTLTFEDAEAIANSANVPDVVAVAPEATTSAQVVAGATNRNTRVVGVAAVHNDVRNLAVVAGEFIAERHVQGRSLVAVLGNRIAENLFPDIDPIGQTVRINQVPFRVVGVLEAKGTMNIAGNQDDFVYIPISTAHQRLVRQRTLTGGRIVQTINVQVSTREEIDRVIEDIGALLRQRHRVAEDDFTITSQAELLAVVGEISGIMTLLLGAIAGISLLVGGIGIMNIMLVSVTERTREIGIRKAVGARRSDIMAQFLVEAVVVSLVGGLAGVALGTLGSRAIAAIDLGGQSIPTVITLESVLLATGVAALVGLVSGIYPASRAARLNPIDALRYE